MIAVVDYGGGNLASVRKGLEVAAQGVCSSVGELAPSVRITDDPAVVREAASVVLPGVGAFGEAAAGLRARGLEEPLAEAFMSRRPFLGICIGLQLLFEESEESPGVPGLGLIAGRVRRFPAGVKVPHMGWNQIRKEKEHPLLQRVPEGAHVYFVHSYYPEPSDPQLVATTTDYPEAFCSSVAFGNVFACQFHPEKSQQVGISLLEAFVMATISAACSSH
jgi:glutamine amidotransferase